MISSIVSRRAQPLALTLTAVVISILSLGVPQDSFAAELDELELGIDLTLGSPGDEAEYFFGNVGSVVEDSQDNIFIGDNRLNIIFKFSSSGELLSQYTQTGDGPGDIMPFFTMAIDGNDRILLAGQGGRVAVLDTDFNYLSSFDRPNPSETPKAMDVFSNGSVAIAAVNLSSHTTIDLLDSSYQHQLSFSDTYAAGTDTPWREESTYAGGMLAAAGADELLFAQSAPFLVRIFSASGALLRETAAGGESFVPPPPKPEIHGEGFTMRFLGSTTGIVPIGDGEILVTAFRRDDEGETWGLLCLFDKELNLLGRREVEYVVTATGASSDGRVFLQQRRDDGTRVVRARIRRVKP